MCYNNDVSIDILLLNVIPKIETITNPLTFFSDEEINTLFYQQFLHYKCVVAITFL